MPKILVIKDEEWVKIRHYANYKGVSGGWQNLCRKLEGRLELVIKDVPATFARVKKAEAGLFAPLDEEAE